MKPTVGRIVLIHGLDNVPLAAIIAYVWNDDMINVTAFRVNGMTEPLTSVPSASTRGTLSIWWDWPKRD